MEILEASFFKIKVDQFMLAQVEAFRPEAFKKRKQELIDQGDWASKHGALVRVEFGSVYEMKTRKKRESVMVPRFRNTGMTSEMPQFSNFDPHSIPNLLGDQKMSLNSKFSPPVVIANGSNSTTSPELSRIKQSN